VSAVLLSLQYKVGNGTSLPDLVSLSTAFERAGAEVADVAKHIYPRLLPALEEAVSKQFDARGKGPLSSSWAELTPRYAKWKQKHYPGQPLLELTGQLRAALTDATSKNAQRIISGKELSYGTTGIPYASFHQTGTPGMPQRPPFDFGKDTEKAISKAAMDGVREALKEGSAGLLDFDDDTYTDESGATFDVFRGGRGGAYIVNGGRRTYLKKDKAGRVVKRTFGRKR